MNETHHHYMSLALSLAEQGRFTVSPNPLVGCVIVKDNHIVGQGYHQRAGEHHAEIVALQEAQEQAKEATAYVTLEPCCHQGKTPPCVNSLISAGIKKVYVACMDPNPLVMGKGIQTLLDAGIQVEVGECESAAKQLNEVFFHFITKQRPFVIAKWAMSLDGKTVVNPTDDKQISSIESHHYTHQIRHQVDAILVGARTASHDNPLLTARVDNAVKQPIRIILSGNNAFPDNLHIFDKQFSSQQKTIIAATELNKHLLSNILHKDIELLVLPKDENNQVSLHALLDELGKRNISSLLVEGGMTVHQSFFKQNLVDKIHVYLSPVIIGSSDKKQHLNTLSVSQLGNDFHIISKMQETDNV